MCLSVQPQWPSCSHQHFQFVTAIRILVISFHQLSVNFSVRNIGNTFENDNNGTQKFLLFVQNTQIYISVWDVVKSESLSEEILPNASHLNCIFCVSRTSISVRRSKKTNRIISFLQHQHTHDLFVSIDYKIPSEFVGIFV